MNVYMQSAASMQSLTLECRTALKAIAGRLRSAPMSVLPVPFARKLASPDTTSWKQDLIPVNAHRQLLVDVSVIIKEDARTGIQRVVRALLAELLCNPPAGFVVKPVYASKHAGYCYATVATNGEKICRTQIAEVAKAGPGDVFLGLDLAAHLVPLHVHQLARWKRGGATMLFMVYDLLPVLHPQWFNPKTQRHFTRWLRSVAVLADGAICISNTVRSELEQWMDARYGVPQHAIAFKRLRLGADVSASVPSTGTPEGFGSWLNALGTRPTVAMVGTLEPRKGHDQALNAFEWLWHRGCEVNLVIAGKAGWKVDSLLGRLEGHHELGRRLHWLNQPTDEMLDALYRECFGLLMASEAEGFGLPLVEAACHGKPVLARDIPVFREVAGEGAHYFRGHDAEDLARAVEQWLRAGTAGTKTHSRCAIPWLTWEQSAQELVECILAMTGLEKSCR